METPNNPPRDNLGKFLGILTGQDALEAHEKRFQTLFTSADIKQDPFKLYLHYESMVAKIKERLIVAMHVAEHSQQECRREHKQDEGNTWGGFRE